MKSPKEKANELIAEMNTFTCDFLKAKYCALKAVKQLKFNSGYLYWIEVEKEIRSSYGRR